MILHLKLVVASSVAVTALDVDIVEIPNRTTSGEGRRPIALQDLRNRHAGEDVYLVASGKSLDYIDDSFFHGRVTVEAVAEGHRRPVRIPFVVASPPYARRAGAED